MSLSNIQSKINFFIHPLPIAAVILMALNDHWGKYAFPGVITGKLSDFCGVFYLPIFILALIIAFDTALNLNKFQLNKHAVLAAIVFTDLLMILVKLSPSSARWIESFFVTYLFQIKLVQDPTDLISFAVNPLTYWHLKPYWRSSSKDT